MLNFDLLKDTPTQEDIEVVGDIDVLEMELNEVIEDLEAEEAQEAMDAQKNSVRAHLVSISEDLKEAGEDQSLLNHFKPHLEKCGIDTESNEVAVEGIDNYVTAFDEANKPAEIDPEEAEVDTEVIGAIAAIIALVVALAAGTVVVAAGVGILVIGMTILKGLWKLGAWLIGFTRDNEELIESKKFKENEAKLNLVDAKDAIALTKEYNNIAKSIMTSPDKFDAKKFESMVDMLKSHGYTFDGSSFKPKTVLVPKKTSLAEAGWGESSIREQNKALKELGSTLVKFEQVMKSAEEKAKKAAKVLKEKKEEGAETSDEEKAKAKRAIKIAKAVPKLMMKDTKRIAKYHRYAIKSSME